MVAEAPDIPEPTPKLTAEDAARLQALFEDSRSPFQLARATSTPLHEILDWLALPHIQHHIDIISRLEDDDHRAAAIGALRETLKTAEDPAEKRQAATAIIRAVSRPRTTAGSATAARATAFGRASRPTAVRNVDQRATACRASQPAAPDAQPGSPTSDSQQISQIPDTRLPHPRCTLDPAGVVDWLLDTTLAIARPTPGKILYAMTEIIDPAIHNNSELRAILIREIAASPLCREGAAVTHIEPIEPGETCARQTVTFRLPGGESVRYTFRLIPHSREVGQQLVCFWLLSAIRPTRPPDNTG